MRGKRIEKITHLLRIVLSTTIGVGIWSLGSNLASRPAHAGWEYGESARRRTTKNVAPSSESSEKSDSTVQEPVLPPARVQVFGNGEEPPAKAMTPSEYSEMLKEDQAANSENISGPVGQPVREEAAVNSEFESLRRRIRTRSVAENESLDQVDSKKQPTPVNPVNPVKTKRTFTPPPPMETEVITPQKAADKKVKSVPQPAKESETTSAGEVNAAFPYTHLLPGPFNIPQGTWALGTTVAYGVFDFFQISTNVAGLVQQHLNFQAKVPLIEYPTFVASAFVDYEAYNPHYIDDSNPDQWLKRWQPGLVTGYEITPDMAFFLGGNFSFGKDAPPVVSTSGYLHGAQVNAEWSWLYNPASSRLANNAISLGVKYDLTYSLFGFGLTHHWKNFELGVHYTFADHDRFLPIFGFSMGASF